MAVQTIRATSNVKFLNAQLVDMDGQRLVRLYVVCLWRINLSSETVLDATPEC